jgi:hypothetical protein
VPEAKQLILAALDRAELEHDNATVAAAREWLAAAAGSNSYDNNR